MSGERRGRAVHRGAASCLVAALVAAAWSLVVRLRRALAATLRAARGATSGAEAERRARASCGAVVRDADVELDRVDAHRHRRRAASAAGSTPRRGLAVPRPSPTRWSRRWRVGTGTRRGASPERRRGDEPGSAP